MSLDLPIHEMTPQDQPTVLVVDDDSRNLLAIESVLNGASYRLSKAQTGAEALMALMNGDFAVIVLDVQMPDMSGIDLAKMIKMRKRTQHIPIIFLTAHYREDEHAVLGYDVGAVDYLTKPVNPAVLRSKVNVFVDLFAKTRALAEMNSTRQTAEEALRIANMELAARNESLVREAEERERRIRAESAQAEAEEANAAKDRFLAMLSHELRTPLSPIVHAVTLLQEIECPPAIREHIDIIQRNVRLEARLIDDLLDLARIRNGKLRLELQPVDVHEALRQAVKICQPELAARRIRVVEKLEATDPYVRGDFARLQQVFWNLLTNAAKFSPEDSTVEMITFASDPGGSIHIEFADQGMGIVSDKLDRIFDAFEQGGRRTQAGLGLGLAICKALVQMHSGGIAAHSEGQNRGAKFIVRLPAAAPDEHPNGASKHEITPPQGLRLLVVEDHPDTLVTLTRLLTRRGYTVRTAACIAECLEVAREYEFDLLISDIGLPDGRGTELLEQLHALHGKRPPAIAMSGFGMDDDVERSQQAGFSEHLTKPVEFSALQHAIARLAGSQAE
ncbi:response regulator [Prosthecobacter sp.]|uniref:ATP-binding response regulator n=1 Tax=Prosthecobacter sp. TaxID=1965333 RepID=UPI002489A0A4|nr:response regulator [Prosthecobacter sp.]MDI1312287.1 response regulator [Prosthecobacter sp.]